MLVNLLMEITRKDKMKIPTENTDHAKDNFSYDGAPLSHKILLEESINCLRKLGWEM